MQVDLIGQINDTALLSQVESLTYSKTLITLIKTFSLIHKIKYVDILKRHINIYIVRDECQIEFKAGTQDIKPIKKFRPCEITNKIYEFVEDASLISAPYDIEHFGYNEGIYDFNAFYIQRSGD